MRLLALAAAACFAACGTSPPTRFYTLNPVAPHVHPQSSASAPIKVDAVHVPAILDRESMVLGEAGNQLKISSQNRWGADFSEMARRVLTQDLRDRLPEGMVVSPQAPAPENARGLVIDILNFSPNSDGQVLLDADWVLLQGNPARSVLQHTVHLDGHGAMTAEGEAATMSRLLGQLADQIAAQLNSR